MNKHMSVAEIAEATTHDRQTIYKALKRTQGHVNWSAWRRSAKAYTRQCKAQEMLSEGKSRVDIAEHLGTTVHSIDNYMQGAIDKPDVPPGRTPPWKQDASEHGLWPTE